MTCKDITRLRILISRVKPLPSYVGHTLATYLKSSESCLGATITPYPLEEPIIGTSSFRYEAVYSTTLVSLNLHFIRQNLVRRHSPLNPPFPLRELFRFLRYSDSLPYEEISSSKKLYQKEVVSLLPSSSRELFTFLVEELKPRRSCFPSSFSKGAVFLLVEEVKPARLILFHVTFLLPPFARGSAVFITPLGTLDQVLHGGHPIFIAPEKSGPNG